MIPEVADVKESLIELEAATFDYSETLAQHTRGQATQAQLDASLAQLNEAGEVLRAARARLQKVAREFADLNSLLGGEVEVQTLREKLRELGFGGDFGLGE